MDGMVEAPVAAQRQPVIFRWPEDTSACWLLVVGAVSWAVAEGLLRLNPLAGMRGPPRPRPRRHHSLDEVRRLLAAAGQAAASAQEAFRDRPGSVARARRLFAAEQLLLLVRLAADSGRGGASWPCCGCRTRAAGCSLSSGACRGACSARPSRAGPGG
jgi:hypothetical protein